MSENGAKYGWPGAISDLAKLGGGVLVACFALWLVVPTLLDNNQNQVEKFQEQIDTVINRGENQLTELRQKAEEIEKERQKRIDNVDAKLAQILKLLGAEEPKP